MKTYEFDLTFKKNVEITNIEDFFLNLDIKDKIIFDNIVESKGKLIYGIMMRNNEYNKIKEDILYFILKYKLSKNPLYFSSILSNNLPLTRQVKNGFIKYDDYSKMKRIFYNKVISDNLKFEILSPCIITNNVQDLCIMIFELKKKFSCNIKFIK